MRRQDWAVLAFRVIGAAITAYGLIALVTLFGAFGQNTTGVDVPAWAILLGLLPAWTMIGVGAAFWIGAPALGARAFTDAAPPDFAEPLDVNGVLQVALVLLGTYFVLDAIPQLLQGGMLYLYSRRMSTSVLGYDPERHDALRDERAGDAPRRGRARGPRLGDHREPRAPRGEAEADARREPVRRGRAGGDAAAVGDFTSRAARSVPD